MRIVIQRVSAASVRIHDEVHASIQKGMMILLGIEASDGEEDVNWLCGKIVNLRIFNDANLVPNLSVKEIQGDVLLISQFTLHALTKKGNRPSYVRAARPEQAKPLYELFVQQLEQLLGKPIGTGIFGADMKVTLTNDGPITIIMDSKNKET